MSLIYYKNNQPAANVLIFNGKQIINPTSTQLEEAGYELVYVPDSEFETLIYQTNEDIKAEREKQYRTRSDSHFIAYQKYLALDQLDRAEEAKRLWLKEIEAINNEYPYMDSKTTESITE